MGWNLGFIKDDELIEHVSHTIEQYKEKLAPCTIERFNKNTIDPIKMLFDRKVYGKNWKTIIDNEIFRQRDKANTNEIGFFHQRLFEFINNCRVPAVGQNGGWDVIYTPQGGYRLQNGDMVRCIYVEMKNKHNTMNSASAAKTYIKMQHQLLENDDCACFLVEAIAKKSQDIAWQTTIDGKQVSHARIRRVSIDQFYAIVTGVRDAFYQLCMVLPEAIAIALQRSDSKIIVPKDTVCNELVSQGKQLGEIDSDKAMLLSLYLLGFGGYLGFPVSDNGVAASAS